MEYYAAEQIKSASSGEDLEEQLKLIKLFITSAAYWPTTGN